MRAEAGEEELDLDEFAARVTRGEVAPHCPVLFPAVTGDRWVAAGTLEIFKSLYQPRRLYFARAFNLGRFPRVTAIAVLLNVAVYLAMNAHGPVDMDTLVAFGAKVRPLVFDLGELWRLVTANVVHVDVLHIAFNLLVLFNVGGALENAFRTADYVLLLCAAALGTTVASLAFAPDALITAGASGIVYGLLAAAVVFGIKYREILPTRYRRILGEWTIPPVLAFLYIGWIQKSGVDNWGHVGGLCAGGVTAAVLRPRLLAEPLGRAKEALRAAPVALAVLAAMLGGLLARAYLPTMQRVRDDALGIAFDVPAGWRRAPERPGELGHTNGLGGAGRAAIAVRARAEGGPEALRRAPEAFARAELYPREAQGKLNDLQVLPGVPATVADRRGALLEASYAEDGQPMRLKVTFWPRGELLYQVAVEFSAAYPAYEAVLDRLVASVAFEEPRAVREARAQVLLDASNPTSLAALCDLLVRFGDADGAAAALGRAVAQGRGAIEDEARLRARLDHARRPSPPSR